MIAISSGKSGEEKRMAVTDKFQTSSRPIRKAKRDHSAMTDELLTGGRLPQETYMKRSELLFTLAQIVLVMLCRARSAYFSGGPTKEDKIVFEEVRGIYLGDGFRSIIWMPFLSMKKTEALRLLNSRMTMCFREMV